MMKITLVLTVLCVSAYAKGLPFGFYNNNPYNMDTPDDQDQAAAVAAAQGGQQQAADQNEFGDTLDDQDQVAAAGQGAVAQGATTIPPVSAGADGGDSSSSSSEEEGSYVPDVPATTYPVAGPLAGAGQGQAGQAAANAGDSSGNIPAAGGPIFDTNPVVQPGAVAGAGAGGAGGDSGNAVAPDANPGGPSPLKVHQQQVQSQGRKSGALIAVTTLGLVAGVAATSFVAYKYKDAITARLGM